MTRYQADIIAAAEVDLPWEKLQGCNILVTGATGLIGGCIVEILMSRKHDYHVYAAGRNEQRAMARFSRYAGDASFHFCNTTYAGNCIPTPNSIISSMRRATPVRHSSRTVRWK